MWVLVVLLIIDVILFQIKLSEKTSLLEEAEHKIANLTAKVNEQQKLIQKLEDDILKVGMNFLLIFVYIGCLFVPLKIGMTFVLVIFFTT